MIVRGIKELADRLGVSRSVAEELYILSGSDVELAVAGSQMSRGLDQAKANVLNMRIQRIEDELWGDD